jgi:hypothetical protein
MSIAGIEPRTSQTLGNHLTECAIADVTRTYIKLVGVFQTLVNKRTEPKYDRILK